MKKLKEWLKEGRTRQGEDENREPTYNLTNGENITMPGVIIAGSLIMAAVIIWLISEFVN